MKSVNFFEFLFLLSFINILINRETYYQLILPILVITAAISQDPIYDKNHPA